MTTGAPVGWGCILSNTVGTLNSGATTGAITISTNLLTVNTVAGMNVGDWIDIVGVTGSKQIVNINATTLVVTLDAVANATVIGAGVTYHNETTANAFKAMANLP